MSTSKRFYVLPIEQVENRRGPKHLKWRYDPDPPGLDVVWNMMDYGLLPTALVAVDASDEQHASLANHADVIAFPVDLDQAIANTETLTDALETLHFPMHWLTTEHTYRELVRMLAGYCQLGQRHHGLHNRPLVEPGETLNTPLAQMPADKRQALDEIRPVLRGKPATHALRHVIHEFATNLTGKIHLGGHRL